MKFLGQLAVALCIMAVPTLPARAVPAPAAAEPAALDPLAQLNARFRDSYAKARADRLARGGPVLLVSGGRMSLYRGGVKVVEEAILPALYHRFKQVDHVPLALQLMLSAPAAPEQAGELRAVRTLALAAREGLAAWCPVPALPRQRQILDACVGILDAALAPAGLEPGRLAAFSAGLGPLLLANADAAAALELEQLDRAATRLQEGLAPGERAALAAVVTGAHMPRDGEVACQYFFRLLGETREGGRVIYAEGLWDPAQALDLLATHRLDGEVGAASFGDPLRMHRDVMADGARKWLDTHPSH